MAKANHNASKPRAKKHVPILKDPPPALKRALEKYINAGLATQIIHPDYVYDLSTKEMAQPTPPVSRYNFPDELRSVVAVMVEFNRTFSEFVDEMVGPTPKPDGDAKTHAAPVNCYIGDLQFSAYTLRQLAASNNDLFKRLREYL